MMFYEIDKNIDVQRLEKINKRYLKVFLFLYPL